MPIILSKKAGGGGGSSTPSGPAGGSLSGTYPDPTLAADSVNSAEIVAGAVGRSELATGIGAIDKLASSVLGVAGTFDFNNIAQTYTHLWLIMQLRTTANSGANGNMVLNADTSAIYYREKLTSITTTVAGAAGAGESNAAFTSTPLPGNTDTAGRAGTSHIHFPFYALTTFHKEWLASNHMSVSTAAGGQVISWTGGTYASTSAITRVQIEPSAGATFVAGSSATLYGIV